MRVREALALAIDRERVTRDDLGGATWGADLGWGGSSERAQWFFGASYYKQREIASSKFANASVPVPGTGLANGSSATPQGRFVFQDPNTGQSFNLTPNDGATFHDTAVWVRAA